jgi:hypothetical protein
MRIIHQENVAMVTHHTTWLTQLHAYVDSYIAYLGEHSTVETPEITTDLHQVIQELERLRTLPAQDSDARHLAQRISDQLGHLRTLLAPPHAPVRGAQAQRARVQAGRTYLEQELRYLERVSDEAWWEQVRPLLRRLQEDLEALAHHPPAEQEHALAIDLEACRTQLAHAQQLWQQQHGPP